MYKYVSEIMSKNVTMVSVDSTVDQAEQRMLKHKRRCVPVVDDKRKVFGVLSYSDILKQRHNQVNLKTINVWEICTHNVFSVLPEATIEAAIEVMVQNGVHHILVLQDKKVEGIVSVLDIMQLYRKRLDEADKFIQKTVAVGPDSGINPIYKL